MLRTNPNQKQQALLRRVALSLATLGSLLLGLAGPAAAGSDGRKGTAGASELLIPVGARGSALGNTIASDVSGIEAIYYNPAGLAGATGADILFSHTTYFADMKVNYAAVAAPVGNLGVMGISAKILSVGDVIVTTEAAPDGTGEILTPTFSVLGLTWAKAFTDRVHFGGTVNYVNENIANNSASGVGFDFGVQYATDWNGLKFGMSMKNIGTTMSFSGPGFEILTRDPNSDPNSGNRGLSFSSTGFEMPSYFTLSSSYELARTPQQHLTVLGAYQSNNFNGDNLRGGLEWSYRDMFDLRGSVFGTFNGTTDATTGEESFKFDAGDELYAGYALGAGLRTKFGDKSKLGVDISWRPVQDFFDDIVEVGLRFEF